MSKKDFRRHHRVPYIGRVRISWEDSPGLPKFAAAKCLDVSEGGMRLETLEPIKLYTILSLRAEQINISGSATVKHVERHGSKYVLGLEMSQSLRDRTLALIAEEESSRKPVPSV